MTITTLQDMTLIVGTPAPRSGIASHFVPVGDVGVIGSFHSIRPCAERAFEMF